MKKEIKINFEWWSYGGEAVPSELEDVAVDRINRQFQIGNTSGELFYVTDDDVAFRGWWSMSKRTL